MLQRSRESSSGATTLPSISLHQMNQDAADTAFHGLHSVQLLGPFLTTLHSWCSLVGFALNMELVELKIRKEHGYVHIPSMQH